MILPEDVHWEYRSQGPYIVERYGPHEDMGGHHMVVDDFVEAMTAFWYPDISQPAFRHVFDGQGKCILGQICGRDFDMVMTAEVDRWCERLLSPEVYATFKHIPHCYRLMNRKEYPCPPGQ